MALTFLSHMGQILSQQTRASQLFKHCQSLQIGTSIKPVHANRAYGHVPRLITCKILETSKARITNLSRTAISIGHFCGERTEIKFFFSFPLCLLDRGLLDILWLFVIVVWKEWQMEMQTQRGQRKYFLKTLFPSNIQTTVVKVGGLACLI